MKTLGAANMLNVFNPHLFMFRRRFTLAVTYGHELLLFFGYRCPLAAVQIVVGMTATFEQLSFTNGEVSMPGKPTRVVLVIEITIGSRKAVRHLKRSPSFHKPYSLWRGVLDRLDFL